MGIKYLLFILMTIKFYNIGHETTFLDITFQIACACVLLESILNQKSLFWP